MRFINKIFNSRFGILIMLLFLVLINGAASFWHTRIDFTNEHRFTLSAGTKSILKGLDAPVSIDVFLKENYSSGFKKLASSTEDLLREFKEVAGNNIQSRFISPDDLVDGTEITYADTLSAMGLSPINLTAQVKGGQQQQNVYPFALIHFNDKLLPVELYKGKSPLISFKELNNAEALLEYNIANGIAKIRQTEKAKIGYAIGNGEPADYSVYDLAELTLKPNYNLELININQQPFINPEFSALLLVKPKIAFTDPEKLKLDQYIMQGGKVLFFIDRLNAEMDSLQIKNEVIAYDRELNLNDQLFKYGARINPNLLMDLQCDFLPFDVNGNGQFELLPWNYFPVIESADNHPINKNLGFISGRFVNSIDTVEVEGIKKTILLHSSVNARTIATPALISGRENVSAPEDDKYKLSNVPVAVLLEGKFKSFFANRLTNELKDSLAKYGMNFMANCDTENKIIVVSDGDIVLNSVVKGNQPLPMGMNPYTYGTQRAFPFSNKDFILNSLDYLINKNGLSEAKSKDYVLRLLDTKKLNSEKTYWQIIKINPEKIYWQSINILLPIYLVIIFAIIFQWLRKRKFTNKFKNE